jgi:hypothetical protein
MEGQPIDLVGQEGINVVPSGNIEQRAERLKPGQQEGQDG